MAEKATLQKLTDWYNFSFVVPGKLAGMSRPDHDASELLRQAGITGILTLTENPLPDAVREGFEYLHLGIADFTAPTLNQISHAVEFINFVKGPVAAHCFAGIGRTGTILAAYLVSEGTPSNEAVGKVRRLRPHSLETAAQEAVVYEYEIFLKEKDND
jgi:atypical dual specificity phosphatase